MSEQPHDPKAELRGHAERLLAEAKRVRGLAKSVVIAEAKTQLLRIADNYEFLASTYKARADDS